MIMKMHPDNYEIIQPILEEAFNWHYSEERNNSKYVRATFIIECSRIIERQDIDKYRKACDKKDSQYMRESFDTDCDEEWSIDFEPIRDKNVEKCKWVITDDVA